MYIYISKVQYYSEIGDFSTEALRGNSNPRRVSFLQKALATIDPGGNSPHQSVLLPPNFWDNTYDGYIFYGGLV